MTLRAYSIRPTRRQARELARYYRSIGKTTRIVREVEAACWRIEWEPLIRGETYHFEIVANESASGIAGVQLEFGIPIGNGVLTCDSDSQAEARMDAKGYEAAVAALELANLLDAIDKK